MTSKPLSLAISPCPNDTFTFHALVHGLVDGAPPVDVTYADIDVTNTAALDGRYDMVKVSYAALPWLMDEYELLGCGGALGRGCGPLLLVKDASASDDLRGKTVAVPGDRTTAYLLFRLWAVSSPRRAPERIIVAPFEKIMPGVADGTYDAGLVIHEARFTFPRYGLTALVDLGEWWESDTGLPIPLGAILAHRRRVDAAEATKWVRESVRGAWSDPAATDEYVLAHAQEMERPVVRQHIDLYVNSFTEDLGPDGYAAVRSLLGRAAAEGLVPAIAPERLARRA